MLSAEDEKLFRQWEVTHLDTHHERLRLWSHTGDEAGFAVLALHDSLLLDEAVAAGAGPWHAASTASVIGSAPKIHAIQEGVSQALRWLLPRIPPAGVRPVLDEGLYKLASEFVDFGEQYVHLSDLHKLYGKGLADVHIERTPPTVTFDIQEVDGATPPITAFVERIANQSRHVLAQDSTPYHALSKTFSAYSTAPRNGRLELVNPARSITSTNVELALKRGVPDLPEIVASTPLPAFTVGEFDRVWAGLWLWSFIAQFDYVRRAIAGEIKHAIWPTQLNETAEVITVLSRACGLDSLVVERILRTLALDTRLPAADLWLQPLLFGTATMAWSVRTIMVSRPRRNLFRLLARTGYSDEVAEVVGQLASPTATRLAAKLKKYGYVVEMSINVSNSSKSGEVDLLAWSKMARFELLVVECKGSLPPDEVAEVASLTKTATHAKEQLRRCLALLASSGPALMKKYPSIPWLEIQTRVGLIVFYDGTPDHGYSHEEFPATDLPTILRGMRSRDFKSPSHIATAVRSGSARAHSCEFNRGHNDVSVDGVTYRIPFSEIENSRT